MMLVASANVVMNSLLFFLAVLAKSWVIDCFCYRT
jgi:hypothetical protein